MKTIQGYTYKVSQYIGKGYSSTVHKGINDKNGQQVSIKVIQMAKLQDPINQMLLQLQVSALKALNNSKHVLHLYDVYATRNNTYLVTQLCQGDLNMIIKQRKTLPYYQVVEIMRQLIVGYYDIHKAGFIHRDIKPANIFHKNGVYKYGDFGFTIPYNDIKLHKNYNVGSPVYMPPQALKENNYSISCDIWAIGIIFFQLLKGVVPWRAISQQVLYDKIISQPIQGLSLGLPSVAKQFLAQVLCLDSNLRISPQVLLTWPAKLQSAPIDIRSISPNLHRNPTNVLRQININTNTNTVFNDRKSGVFFTHNSNCTKNIEQKHINQFNTNLQVPQIKNQGKQSIHIVNIKNQAEQSKQALLYATNSINYIQFLHRILKFIQYAAIQSLKTLQKSVVSQLYRQVQKLNMLFLNKNQNVQNKIHGWSQFIKSQKFQQLLGKFKKCSNKYRMIYEEQHGISLNQKDVMQAINIILSNTSEKQYKPRLIVAADYLITLFQLIHLKNKYDPVEFLKMSKIDLIMQGDPYSVCPQHLQKVKKKLILISP